MSAHTNIIEFLHGDNREILPMLPDNLVDTVITDPPYGLKFMGKKWDYEVPTVEQFAEMLRVAKPGAIMLCFGGTRTYHRIAVNIEDAGWEIRDCIMWVYGSGFPKSMDISKAIDKAAGAERNKVGEGKGRTGDKVACHLDVHGDDAYEWPGNYDITAPSTDLAKLWNGWGTALKPAVEPICVAMKPLDGTFAQNAEKWGVGGLWIDGGRVPYVGDVDPRTFGGEWKTDKAAQNVYEGGYEGLNQTVSSLGRFPANIILDEEAAAMLDEQTGGLQKSKGAYIRKNGNRQFLGAMGTGEIDAPTGICDSGGASRFFYAAKASKAERNGSKHPTVKPLAVMEYLCKLTKTPTGGIVLDPFAGTGTTGEACLNTGRDFVGIEGDPIFYNDALRRIERARGAVV